MNLLNQAIDKISGDHALTENGVSPEVSQQFLMILEDMMERGEDINAAMVSSLDGIAWADKLGKDFDQHRFAAMSGALLALSDNLAKEGEKGLTNNVLLEGEMGNIFLLHAGAGFVLTVFTKSKNNMGMSLAHAKIASQSIATFMEDHKDLI